MTEVESYIALNMINGLGSVLINRLVERFGRAGAVFSAEIKELTEVSGITPELSGNIKSILTSDEFFRELRQIKDSNVKVITIADKIYPEVLRQIYDPPVLLYMKGSPGVFDNKMLAVIGCRRASSYGLKQARKLAYELAGNDFCIVSGMAKGIDTEAHKGALQAQGKTIAVLGSGFSKIYPPENKPLFDKIAESGAVVSEYSMNTAPLRGNFPRRNRIISGLSQAVIVIEAAKKSGSLITADLALSQGREVFAMPGAANSFNCQGTNKLIKDGAKLIENYQDVLDGLEVIWDFKQ